jgi:hypothetical protein
MKKNLLLMFILLATGTLFAQETITGWTFPVNSGADSLNANLGSTTNKSYDLRFQMVLTATSDSTINTITFVNGATTYAAATKNWDNGADSKFWSIKFKANNYTNFKLSSKQMSGATDPGPRDFKIQWRLSSGTYADVTNGTVSVGTDWTGGVVTDLPVPITGQGSSSIYVRWIMTSNTSVTGTTVAATAESMIDDILVTAQNSTGQREIVYTNRLRVNPSPNHGTFTLTSTEPIDLLTIVNVAGKEILNTVHPQLNQQVSLPNPVPGIYILKVKFTGNEETLSTKFIVE